MRGPAGTGCDGWGAGRPRRKEGEWGEGPLLAITAMFFLEYTYIFWLSVSIRKVASEYPFCVLTPVAGSNLLRGKNLYSPNFF